jgi:hypothetical protein
MLKEEMIGNIKKKGNNRRGNVGEKERHHKRSDEECKETDKQILEEGRCCRVKKSKECKETDRQIPEEACCHRE